MPKRDEVRIIMTSGDAAAAEAWLIKTYIPFREKQPETILGFGAKAQALSDLTDLAGRLGKAARRKRTSPTFEMLVPRVLAARFPRGSLAWQQQPSAAGRIGGAMQVAAQARAGRPQLTADERATRINRLLPANVDERHRKRLKRAAKADASYEDWLEGLRQRGETVLTATTLPPKI